MKPRFLKFGINMEFAQQFAPDVEQPDDVVTMEMVPRVALEKIIKSAKELLRVENDEIDFDNMSYEEAQLWTNTLEKLAESIKACEIKRPDNHQA